MPFPWNAVINAAASVVTSLFDNRSKQQKQNQANNAKASVTKEDVIAGNMIAAGYVKQGDTWVSTTPEINLGADYEALKKKRQKADFGGPPLTPEEEKRFLQYRKQIPEYRTSPNAMTNPIDYTAGLASGLGSYNNPGQIPNIDISASAIKKAGMSPLLWLGLIGGGAGILYAANKKPKRRR